MFYALAIFCATAFVLAAADLELPVKTCKRDASDYANCLKLAAKEAWPKFIPGIPELEIPVLDPYFIDQERIVYESADINIDVTVTNCNTYGLAKAELFAVRPEHSDNFFKLEFDIGLSTMLVEGNFKAVGSVKGFQLDGEGTFNISMEDIKTTIKMEGPVANDRWTLEHCNLINPEIGKMNVWFSDMFNGNDELTAAAMKFVNEYWPVLYREMLPTLQKNFDDHLTTLTNRVFSKVSFSKTFP